MLKTLSKNPQAKARASAYTKLFGMDGAAEFFITGYDWEQCIHPLFWKDLKDSVPNFDEWYATLREKIDLYQKKKLLLNT